MNMQVSDLLDDLIEAAQENQNCYAACAVGVGDSATRRMLARRVRLAQRCLKQLKAARETYGAQQCEGPALAARIPLRAAAMLAPADGDAWTNCERQETRALMRYRDALDYDLPIALRKLLQRQFDVLLRRPEARSLVPAAVASVASVASGIAVLATS